MKEIKWIRLLAYVTGLVNQELLLQNEYLTAENRVLRAHLPARLRLSDPERSSLAEIAKRLGRKVLAQVACLGQTGQHFGLVSEAHRSEVRRLQTPPLPRQAEDRTATGSAHRADGQSEFRLGYDRIVGALANLGHVVWMRRWRMF